MKAICSILPVLLLMGANELFAQSGFRVDVTPIAATEPLTVQSQWTVRLQQRSVLLQWRTIPFSQQKQPTWKTDTLLSTRLVSVQGALVVNPVSASTRTRIATQVNQATIQMAMQGTGKADVLMQIGIDPIDAVAGVHWTTVELTVTGN